jgi:cation-transporting P-type ATPase E
VAGRVAQGLANASRERPSRSVAEILRANIVTRFNFILGSLSAVILVVGQLQDALFGILDVVAGRFAAGVA